MFTKVFIEWKRHNILGTILSLKHWNGCTWMTVCSWLASKSEKENTSLKQIIWSVKWSHNWFPLKCVVVLFWQFKQKTIQFFQHVGQQFKIMNNFRAEYKRKTGIFHWTLTEFCWCNNNVRTVSLLCNWKKEIIFVRKVIENQANYATIFWGFHFFVFIELRRNIILKSHEEGSTMWLSDNNNVTQNANNGQTIYFNLCKYLITETFLLELTDKQFPLE